jgi:RNA recognition motif-containing protein
MNIYVGNLAYSLTEDELAKEFANYGEVISTKIIVDRENNNRSKGFGFIEMSDDSAAKKAIEELNGKEVAGRTLRVNEAKPRQPRRY